MEDSAIVIAFIVFTLGCISICAHRVNAQMAERRATIAAITRYHQHSEGQETQGIAPEAMTTLPIVKYSDVKDIQIGKGILECAICLTEFSDEDLVRLLPECDHVFHPLCIDQWLASHATCPVCRTNLLQPTESNSNNEDSLSVPSGLSNYHVAIHIDDDARCSTANLIAFDSVKEARRHHISNNETTAEVGPPIRSSDSVNNGSEGFGNRNEQVRSPLRRDPNGVAFEQGEECPRMTYRYSTREWR